MEVSRTNVDVWKKRFLRTNTVDGETNFTALGTLSDAVANEAGELITINSANMEGGGGSGILTGNKMEMLMALEELLEQDPNGPITPVNRSRLVTPDFSLCQP